jgi:glycine C-acetyltransferase
MKAAGFTVMGHDDCPIAPIFFGKGEIAGNITNELFDRFNIYVSAFSYPVVPKGEARIRCIYTGVHTKEQIE